MYSKMVVTLVKGILYTHDLQHSFLLLCFSPCIETVCSRDVSGTSLKWIQLQCDI